MLIHSNAALVMRNIRSLGKNVENDVPRNNQLAAIYSYIEAYRKARRKIMFKNSRGRLSNV